MRKEGIKIYEPMEAALMTLGLTGLKRQRGAMK